ncbi:uncharacterized protein LOC128725856 [Anopheles nili]|uniref:uncharacterized protein LOC128725856 n=1 Tax=Anopheles nili TaxID=185578 RepID=UPI00237B6DF1|nr:uncharacterized protein LOC128725856 [Anopheles nili]
MEVNLVETMFEAISTADEETLTHCLKQATIDTVLQFGRTYGESPMHLCVKIGGMSHLGVVRCLMKSGLFDSTVVDGEADTVLECAYKNRDSELINELIKMEIEGLHGPDAYYKILRHNSLAVFKIFLSISNHREEESFENITGALIQLNVKSFVLMDDLRIFTMWKLSDYAYRHLSGNWHGVKNPNEWKQHIDVACSCWSVISQNHDTQCHADVDNQLLHQLQTIHNHLYFLKHKQFLGHLPMQEVIFYVAIFISIFKNSSQFREYRLVVNKCMVVEFLRSICWQLDMAKAFLESMEGELILIITEMVTQGASTKDRLIEELLVKIESSKMSNREYLVKQFREKVNMLEPTNKDILIKEMMEKIKKIDKKWIEKKQEEIKAANSADKSYLMEQIGKRLPHVVHPQNVANKMMAEWKKGKGAENIVADIISGESFDFKHLLRGKDRRVIRKLKKCYIKTKQFYSLHKIVFYCDQILHTKTTKSINLTACMKRVVQVIGEAIKNTQNSANMPGMAGSAVRTMLTNLFPDLNRLLREVFSHGTSLKKVLVGEEHETWQSKTFHKHMPMVRAVFYLLYVIVVVDIRHSFYGQMRSCGSMKELRSLLLYVGETDELARRQESFFESVKKYFQEAKATFTELRKLPIGETPHFKHLQTQLEVKCGFFQEVDKYFTEDDGFSYNSIRRACFSSSDFSSIRRLLDWKLTMSWANSFFRKIRLAWKTSHVESMPIEWMDHRVLSYNPSVIAGILKNKSMIMDCVEAFEYPTYARELVQAAGIEGTLQEEDIAQLNKRLKSYYNNMFFIDNKCKVLESFCNEQKLHLDKGRLQQLVKQDKARLQEIFDAYRSKLFSILKEHNLSTIDGLVSRMFYLPTYTLAAIEYLQLELCEMLYAVGYFGDSFHYMKHRIPVIQGKNYRNFLAHDCVSYNVLTDSLMEKVVINAFVLATTEIQLFANHRSKDITFSFPSLDEMQQWVDVQQQLLAAFQTKDYRKMHAIVQAGGEIKSLFCSSPNASHVTPDCYKLNMLVNPCGVIPTVVEYLERYFAGFRDQRLKLDYQLEIALRLRDYQAAFDLSIGRGNRLIRDELFAWPELMSNLQKNELFVHPIAAVNWSVVLSKLVEHGNEQGVREILPYFDSFCSTNDRGPLGDAMLYCVRSIAELLLPRTTVPHPAVILLSIILHWDDVFTNMMNKIATNPGTYQFLLVTTAQARNYTAAVYLFEQDAHMEFLPAMFVECGTMAVRRGAQDILQHLLQRCPTLANPTGLAKIMHQAALKKRWNCVDMLLDHGALADVLFPSNFKDENCTLLLLVKYGQNRLLRKVISVNCKTFGVNTMHPFAVAVRHEKVSRKMICNLNRLGFDWMDNSSTFHESLENSNKHVLDILWSRINEVLVRVEDHADRVELGIHVLQRWNMIGFVEESTISESSLFVAVRKSNIHLVQTLLDWSRKARVIDGTGILRSIAFQRDSSIACFGDRSHRNSLYDTSKEIIDRIKTCARMDGGQWQELMVASSTQVTFSVLINLHGIINHPENLTFDLRNSESLLESLRDLSGFANTALSHCAIVFAQFPSPDGGTNYFWQCKEICVLYNILPLGSNIDLTDMVNCRDAKGETPLHKCFPKDTLEMVKLLVENGANPLLADHSGLAAIHLSLLNSLDFAVGRYLFDESIRRKLCNDKGMSVLELDDGIRVNRLIHTVVTVGRRDILERLLQYNVDVTQVNGIGATPVILAAGCGVQNPLYMVKMLLDHDSTNIDVIDFQGNTLLHYAVRLNSIKLLELILQYKPNLKVKCEITALGRAILEKHVECAKYLLNYAIENKIRGITTIDEEDLVCFSLLCNNYELSKAMLEYELEHSLEEIGAGDLLRIKAILDGPFLESSSLSLRTATIADKKSRAPGEMQIYKQDLMKIEESEKKYRE